MHNDMVYSTRKRNNTSQVLSETLFLGRFFSLRFTSSELDATIHWLHYYLKRSSLVSLSRLEDVPLVCSITENPFAKDSTPVCYHAQGENPR